MPEGPEVYVMTTKFSRRFPVGTKLVKVNSLCKRYENLTVNLPLQIKEIYSRGKKSVIKCNKNVGILVSYGMSGHWELKNNKYAQLEFVGSNGKKYYWTTSRSLPICSVQFLPLQKLQNELDRLGVDIIHHNPRPQEVLNVFGNRKQNICAFMMDQTKFAGIGNYIKAVVLYRCGISPHCKVCDLYDDEKWLIWTTAQQVASEAIAAQGMGIKDYKDENGELIGVSFDITPYQMEFDALGNKVISEQIAGRTTWWVPKVQN